MASFIRNFLMDRKFNVRCGSTHSPNSTLDPGLPQGSVLSPTLFLIMINDLFQHSSSLIKHSIYADDVAVWTTNRDINLAYTHMQNALDDISTWCEQWGLEISHTKTMAVIFAKPRSLYVTPPKLTYNNKNIEYAKHFKYLGITLDSRLTFNAHFEHIKQRCARRLNVIRCISGKDWGSDRSTLLRLYIALIRPILDYNAFLFDEIASKKI